MSTAIGKRTTTALKISSETSQMRRRIAQAEQLFDEGLQRLQANYKERVLHAVGASVEIPETTPKTAATPEPPPVTAAS